MSGDFKVYLMGYHSEVTGSRMMLNIEYPDGRKSRKIMFDCGYYQEIAYRHLNYEHELNPADIDVIIISHNHIDHTGLLPKMVSEGYIGPIYMTNITRELLPAYLVDSAKQQPENAEYLRKRYRDDAYKFRTLYTYADVDKVLTLTIGVNYRKKIEVLPGVYVTFFENGHLLGAACVLVQITCYGKNPINFFFTGDYRSRNPLFFVPTIPRWVKKLELNIVCESTYGGVESTEIHPCFEKNMMEAFAKRMNILDGAFSQGRYQEILYFYRIMQEEGKIPPEYEICIDGALGISTCWKYMSILKRYYPNSPNFMPEGIRVLDDDTRNCILGDVMGRKTRIILITTSGMLSNGPARVHVPNFIERPDCMIHLCGYAAEETIARQLLDTIDKDKVRLWGKTYHRRATVRTTREFSRHAPADELIKFLQEFKTVRFVAVNHGSKSQAAEFVKRVVGECPNVEEVGRLNRQTMFCFIQKAKKGSMDENIAVKALPAKLCSSFDTCKQEKRQNTYKKTSKDTKSCDRRERRR